MLEFGQQIDFEFYKHAVQDFASSPGSSKQSLGPPTRACAKLLVRSGLRCSLCFRLKSECLCPETQKHKHMPHIRFSHSMPIDAQEPLSLLMGQASRFRVGEPVFRFHASDSEASSPSVASSGFAQVLGDDFRFFPSEDEVSPAVSSDSLSSRLSRPGLRYRHPRPWVPIDIRPRYMYSTGLLAITASASAEARCL